MRHIQIDGPFKILTLLRSRMVAVLTLIALFGSSVAVVFACVNPPQSSTLRGWRYGRIGPSCVPYNTGGLPGNIPAIATTAFNEWNTALAEKGQNFRFCPGSADASGKRGITFTVGMTSERTPAATLTERSGEGGQEANKAVITIDLNNVGVAAGKEIWWDPNSPGYEEAVKSVFLHEILHTMGVNNMPVDPRKPCLGQTAGASIMNGLCGKNDRGHTLPQSLTDCDKNVVRAYIPVYGGGGGTPPTSGSGDGEASTPYSGNPNDYDGDGVPYWWDCNDASASIYPGRNDPGLCEDFEMIGDTGLDMDCDGGSELGKCTEVTVVVRIDYAECVDGTEPECEGAPAGPGSTILSSGQALASDQSSDAEGFTLRYQLDGNFVLYTGSSPVWATMTNGTTPGQAVMQLDGNLVVYDSGGTPIWNTGTWGHSGAYLKVTPGGTLQVVDTSGSVLWSS